MDNFVKIIMSIGQKHDYYLYLMKELLSLADSMDSVPSSDLLDILRCSIKRSGLGVASTFFDSSTEAAMWGFEDHSDYRDGLAVYLVTYYLSKVTEYSFSDAVKGRLAFQKLEEEIKSEKGQKIGLVLLKTIFSRNHNFWMALTHNAFVCKLLEEKLSEKAYVVGNIVEDIVRHNAVPNKIKVLFLYLLGSNKVKVVMETWNKYGVSTEVTDSYLDFIYKDNHIQFATYYLENDEEFKQLVTKACKVMTIERYHCPDCLFRCVITFGKAVCDWLNRVDSFNLRTYVYPKNIFNHHQGREACLQAKMSRQISPDFLTENLGLPLEKQGEWTLSDVYTREVLLEYKETSHGTQMPDDVARKTENKREY